MKELLTVSQAAKKLGITTTTLREWDASGYIPSIRTKGNHRRYRKEDVLEILGDNEEKRKTEDVAIYCRVSSHEQKQKGDLERQKNRLIEYCAKNGYKLAYIFEEVASGMSDNRPKLKQLFKLIKEQKIKKVIIEYKDRLTRFQFNIFTDYFSSHNVFLEYIDKKEQKSYEQEFVDDIISLMASFSGKMYGRRSASRRKKN